MPTTTKLLGYDIFAKQKKRNNIVGMLLLVPNLTFDFFATQKIEMQTCFMNQVDRVWLKRSNLDVYLTLVCKHMVNLVINY